MSAQVSREFIENISAFSRKIRAAFDVLVRQRGMTLARARVFYALGSEEGLTQRDLAQKLDLETPTLVRLLDAMEEQSMVQRQSETKDRRVKRIVMTEEGKAMAEDVQNFAQYLRDAVTKDISEHDLVIASQVLRKMMTNLHDLRFATPVE